ncbi:MAG TPA: LptA/OstA family protein [Allosphingosinicella sp.]
MMRRLFTIAALGLGVAAGGIALAQAPGSALQDHNTNAPVDVAADRIEVQDRVDRAIFSGNVDVRQGQLRLNAERITIAYSSQGEIDIDRIDATGGVRLTSPSETARSESAIYDLNERIVTMMGNVVLNQGQNVVRGGRLVLDLDTGRAVMDGGVPGARGTSTTPNGRVTGRFTVPQGRSG